MVFSYVFKEQTHTDCTTEYMQAQGMEQEQIDAVLSQRDYEAKAGMMEKRKEAYKTESDPLMFEWMFDKTAEKENAWREKVAEIKEKYPVI